MSFAVIVGICFIIGIILLLLYVLPMFSMHPLESGKIEGTDIIAIKNRINNLFFIPVGNEPSDSLKDAESLQAFGGCRGNWIVIDAGSAVYALDEKYLFTGDAFKTANGNITVHPYTMDRKAAQETIYGMKEELKKYEKVFTAHYGLVHNASCRKG